MAAAEWFGPEVVPWFAAGLFMLGLAVWLVALDRRRDVNRAFAFFFFIAGLYNISFGLLENSGSVAGPGWLLPVTSLAVPLVAGYFAFTFRNTDPRRERIASSVLVFSLGIVWGLYFLRPGLWAEQTADGVTFGPLFAFIGLIYVGYAVIGLLFGLDAMASEGSRRRSFVLAALGFCFLPTYTGLSELYFVDVKGLVERPEGAFLAAHYITVLALIPVLLLFVLLARRALRTQEDETKSDLSRYLLVFLLPGFTMGLVALSGWLGVDPGGMNAFFEGIWSVMSPLVVGYAMLRHQLFDTHVRIRAMLRFGFTLAAYLAVFIVAWQLSTPALPSGLAALVALAVTGASLLFLPWLRPIVRRVVDRLMPHNPLPLEAMATPTAAAEADLAALQRYLEQARACWIDGVLTAADRTLLADLRVRLGLSADDALAADEQAAREAVKR